MSSVADVSCRVAWADDAQAIAQIQVRAWRRAYSEIVPTELLAQLDAQPFAKKWYESLTKPTEARQRVMVALERNTVVGFAITGPSPDPDSDPAVDGVITELTIDPPKRSQGHGSRLMNACIDTLAADGFTRATMWVASQADEFRRFLTEIGWEADGAHRTLELFDSHDVQLKQIRLHTAVEP